MQTDIIKTGFFQSTRTQRKIIKSLADSSFSRQLPMDFLGKFSFPEYEINNTSGIGLKLKHVEPHEDYWTGCGNPRKHVAIFWLIECPHGARFQIHIGRQKHRMTQGDFIIFDDRIMHSVYSEKTWIGCAYQAVNSKEK
jgi:hypothetical protein